VLAVDLSEPMVAIARAKRSRPNPEYRVVDALALDEGGFDLVYSHGKPRGPGGTPRLRFSRRR
jgi:2-polyprenyl-3-methyl-5-hydroxy-6-metoxy-1,4-benzoquinol methylase